MGTIVAVCTSGKQGVQKQNVGSAAFVRDWGIQNDAHAGNWHRQVSLLSYEQIQAFRDRGAPVDYGAFGENLVVSGFDFKNFPVGTRFCCNDVVLEMTQIGKQCHTHCEIYKVMGECIMPREGVFARVLHGGTISVGDTISLIEEAQTMRVAILTLSDSGYQGRRDDKSGPVIREMGESSGYTVVHTQLLPDGVEPLRSVLCSLCDNDAADLILTTGGTGFSPADLTPEATRDVVDRPAPGIAEAMRYHSLQITPRAMLSRATAGIRRSTLIVNLPGSPKAVQECLEYILPSLEHGLEILRGTAGNCARPE